MMKVSRGNGWWGGLRKSVLILGAGALLLYSAPLWAEDAPASAGADTATDSGVAPAGPTLQQNPTVTDPNAPVSTEPTVAKSAPQPQEAKPITTSATSSVGATPYTGPSSASAIGAFSAEYAIEDNKAITVQRSGGLPPLQFENKAGNWLSGSIGGGESYDSNVFLRSSKQDDFITRVSPAVAFSYLNQLLDWKLGTSLDYRYYAKRTRTEDLTYGLDTTGNIKLYRDYAFILVSDTFTQTSKSTSVDYSSYSSTANVTNLNTLRLNPRLVLPVSSRIRVTPQYTYVNYWYPSQSDQNRQSHTASADLSYELSSRLSPAVGYSFVRMEGQQLQYNQHYPFFRVTYQDDRFTASGTAGYSRVDMDSGKTSDGMIWDISLTYRLATMTFTLATGSDIDQSAFQSSTSSIANKSPQIVTRYSASLMKQLRKATLGMSLYFRENTDASTSNILSRNFGTTGSLSQEIAPRLTGSLTYRVERSDQTTAGQSTVNGQNTYVLLYQLGSAVAYSFSNDWVASGNYSYTNSSCPQSYNYSTNNYTDNTVALTVRKAF